MKLGVVVDGNWSFIKDLFVEFQGRYETEVFSFQPIKLPVSQGRVNDWRLRASLQRFIKRNDLIFFEWAGPLLTISSYFHLKIPIVVRMHSWELYEFAPRINWDAINYIIFVSHAMQRKFVDLYPAQASKTTVIYHGKDLSKYSLSCSRFHGNIGMLCEMTPIKRVYEMILTLYELKEKGYRFSLYLGGLPKKGADNERYYVSMQRAVEKLSLQDQVFFDGWVDNVPLWLEKIDIFISNSYWEGQQNALLEAMAVGCCCFSHFWDGAEEVLPLDFLYSTDTELVRKLIQYYSKPDNDKQQSCAQLRSITEDKFDIRASHNAICKILEKANKIKDEDG